MRSRRMRLALPGSPTKSIIYCEKRRRAPETQQEITGQKYFSQIVRYWSQERSVNPGDQRRHLARILFELGAKRLPQQPLLTSNADVSSGRKQYDRNQQRDPLRPNQSGSQQHSKHARVDRISYVAIR